nr:dirigent protein 11-like [Coffea arabica]
MAKGLAIASLQILSLPLLASLGQSKTVFTNLTFYDHEFQSGDCQSVFPVAGLTNGTGELYQFGTVVVIDNILTRRFSIKSALVGRSQGIAAVTSRDGNNGELVLTFLFTNGKYSGSTVEIKGIFIGSLDVNELAILGGTKQFRYATGYTTFEVVSQVGGRLVVKI